MLAKLHKGLLLGVTGLLLAAPAAQATEYVTTIDAGTYNSTGTITFDDWGYPTTIGRSATDYSPINGFGANPLDPTGGVGQIQHVVTLGPDGLTPNAPLDREGDILGPAALQFPDANMDSAVPFYKWAYTSPAGSTFNNMRIDYDGDYLIAQHDMSFNFYNYFDYENMGTSTDAEPDGRYLTGLSFQPYALSDATGWCGSVAASHPDALEPMAGQVTFDFAFDVYFQFVLADGSTSYSYSSTEIVNGFEMRSYGSIIVDVTTAGGELQHFEADAVINNTNPDNTDRWDVDADYKDLVSFMGAGVVPNTGMWVLETEEWKAGLRGPGVTRVAEIVDESTPGAVYLGHSFAGYAFILGADAERTLDWFDEDVYGPSPTSSVPEPASMLLIGSGLMGLVGIRGKKKVK